MFGKTCVKAGGEASGQLYLSLFADGAPELNRSISFSRMMDPDSLPLTATDQGRRIGTLVSGRSSGPILRSISSCQRPMNFGSRICR
jgi:hypothetical protein